MKDRQESGKYLLGFIARMVLVETVDIRCRVSTYQLNTTLVLHCSLDRPFSH